MTMSVIRSKAAMIRRIPYGLADLSLISSNKISGHEFLSLLIEAPFGITL